MGENNLIDKIKTDWEKLDNFNKADYAEYPSSLMLELTNACNLKCIMCRNSTMKRKRGFMSKKILVKALSEAKKISVKRVALYTTGESLMHPDFIEIARLCNEFGFTTYLTTNGLLLDEKMSRELLSANLESIKISIDGATKEEYEKIRIRGKFETIINNLKTLYKIRNHEHSSMKIYAGVVITRLNEENINLFSEVYGKYVDGIYLSPLVNQSGQLSEMYENLKPDKIKITTKWKPCKILWDRIVVSWEGKLVACCVDYENDMEYGDLNKSTIKSLWNSEQMKDWRRKHLRGDVKDMPLCRTCNAPFIQQVEILEKTNIVEN